MALSDHGIEALDDWATILAGIIPPKAHLASHEHNGADPTIGVVPYVCVVDEKASTTQGGTFTLGGWRVRDLNTEYADTKDIASVAANQVTLPAGTYRCRISAPGYEVARHKAILWNVTDAATELVGSSEYCGATSAAQTRSHIVGVFTIAGTKVFEVRHYASATQVNNGFGVPTNAPGVVEIYTIAEFWKIG